MTLNRCASRLRKLERIRAARTQVERPVRLIVVSEIGNEPPEEWLEEQRQLAQDARRPNIVTWPESLWDAI